MEKKDIDKEIEDLRKEFNKKLNELKEKYEAEKKGKWIPRYREKYYYLSSCLEVFDDINFENTSALEERMKYNKIFKTKEEAQEFINDYKKYILKFEFGIEE